MKLKNVVIIGFLAIIISTFFSDKYPWISGIGIFIALIIMVAATYKLEKQRGK